jgi:hypothetical protein
MLSWPNFKPIITDPANMPFGTRWLGVVLPIPSLAFPGAIFSMKVRAGEFHATFYALRFLNHVRMVSLIMVNVNEEVGLL